MNGSEKLYDRCKRLYVARQLADFVSIPEITWWDGIHVNEGRFVEVGIV